MKVWLITWESSGPHAEVLDPIVAILSGRLGETTIIDFMERICVNNMCNATEIFKLLESGQALDPALREGNSITCGHNPHMRARKVSDFSVQYVGDNIEILEWQEPDLVKRRDDGQPQIIEKGKKVKLSRKADQLWNLDRKA